MQYNCIENHRKTFVTYWFHYEVIYSCLVAILWAIVELNSSYIYASRLQKNFFQGFRSRVFSLLQSLHHAPGYIPFKLNGSKRIEMRCPIEPDRNLLSMLFPFGIACNITRLWLETCWVLGVAWSSTISLRHPLLGDNNYNFTCFNFKFANLHSHIFPFLMILGLLSLRRLLPFEF